jgi:hypothetical protein
MLTENFLNKIENIRVFQTPERTKISEIINDFRAGKIFIPEYQRAFVWDNTVQSRFIESIFMDIPVPPIFLLEKYNEETFETTYEVIDGVQRLSTLLNFANDNLKLSTGLKLPDLERTTFSKLPPPVTRKFLTDRSINVFKIGKNTNPEIQFEIFERLNRGSVSLSHQELRNCMYHGEFNNFLLKLNKKEDYRYLLSSFKQFKEIVHGEQSKNRMLDVEMILRFFTTYESYIQTNKYVSPTKEQLNFYMRSRQNKLDNKEDNYSVSIENLEELFDKSCKLVKKVFSNKPFRRFKVEKEMDFNSFNKSIFDIQMLGFVDFNMDQINPLSDVIYNEFLNLSSFNDVFIDSTSKSTDSKINERMEIWKKTLSDIISNPEYYKNNLSKKIERFTHKNECLSCNSQIKSIDEAYFNMSENRLYHRNCYQKYKNKSSSNMKVRKDNIKFKWFNVLYDLNPAETLNLIVNDVVNEIIYDQFLLDKLFTFDFIGTIEELRERSFNNPEKMRAYKPFEVLSDDNRKIYLETSLDRDYCIKSVQDLLSCLGMIDKFLLL